MLKIMCKKIFTLLRLKFFVYLNLWGDHFAGNHGIKEYIGQKKNESLLGQIFFIN